MEREEFIGAARRASDQGDNNKTMTGADARNWLIAQAGGG